MRKSKNAYIFLAFLVTITLLSVGCNSSKPNTPNTLERPMERKESTSQPTDKGEVAGEVTTLPTKTITIANQEILVEVADTDESRTQGLSGRTKLAEGAGMLFDFANTGFKKPGFWMKDMLFSIDIIWINDGKITGIESNTPLPPEDADLPVYYPPTEVTQVLEVPAGWANKNNILVGESVNL